MHVTCIKMNVDIFIYIYLCKKLFVCVCVCYDTAKYSFCKFLPNPYFILLSSGAARPSWKFQTTSCLQTVRYDKILHI